MKNKLILSSIMGIILLAGLVSISLPMIGLSQSEQETTANPDWWVGYNAGFEVTQAPEILEWMLPPCYLPYYEVDGKCAIPAPDGMAIGLKVIVNNLHRLYHYDIQATGIGYEHLKVFRVLDTNLDYSLNPQAESDKEWFRYGYDQDLASGTTQFERRAWFGFEESCYSSCYGDNSAWVFEWTGVSYSSGEVSLSLDFVYLMQNRGSHNSVDSPPTITVLTSYGLGSTQYNSYATS